MRVTKSKFPYLIRASSIFIRKVISHLQQLNSHVSHSGMAEILVNYIQRMLKYKKIYNIIIIHVKTLYSSVQLVLQSESIFLINSIIFKYLYK